MSLLSHSTPASNGIVCVDSQGTDRVVVHKYVCVPQHWYLVHHLSIPKKKKGDTGNFLTF